ncbi:MAG: glycosyl transferase family 1, partial [Armatimonadota bacterium]
TDFRADIVCVQHEYGIFGGPAGSYLLTLLREVSAPIVATLHTILRHPNEEQRTVLEELMQLSERVVTMSERGREMLCETHAIHPAKVDVIHHGIPAHPKESDAEIRRGLGVDGRKVMLTFGLLSPGKGIETVIEALPEIVKENPNVLYVILGATHPNILKEYGEQYREQLCQRADELGVTENVRWVNQFASNEELTRWICACDVYVTPYLKREQIVSGTLAYAVGLGRAVVSTPLWYAEEILADGRGVLIPVQDPPAMAEAINRIFADDHLRASMQRRSLAFGRQMQWPAVARAYAVVFERSIAQSRSRIPHIMAPNPADTLPLALPSLSRRHLDDLTDGCGILQHAKYSVPNRFEGYCVDDNARLLMLACAEGWHDLASRAMAFVHHAYDPQIGKFRNFMSYEREWLEIEGSDDSNGRSIWSLGVAARSASDRGIRDLADEMLRACSDAVNDSEHLRSHVFASLGWLAIPSSRYDEKIRAVGDRLKEGFQTSCMEDWVWFEDHLSYDNARIAQAAILISLRINDEELLRMGMDALRWLTDLQLDRNRQFAPIGCNGFHCRGGERAFYDQQPLEAAASVSACLAAHQATGDAAWLREAQNAFAWFLGRNSIGSAVATTATGACCDGIQEDGLNRNMGAESTLAYLMALSELRRALPKNPALENVEPIRALVIPKELV